MVLGVSFVALQLIHTVVAPAINRKREDERIEAIVRRVLSEQQSQEAN